MKKMNTKMLVTAGILIALNIILSRFLSINLWNLKFGFTFVSIFVAAYFYGAGFAATVAGIADVIGALLFPSGSFFPGFTLTALLTPSSPMKAGRQQQALCFTPTFTAARSMMQL